MLTAICPECELGINCKSIKTGSTFVCGECSTNLEIIDTNDTEAFVDYAEDEG